MKARHIIYGLALAAANYAYAGYTPVAITQSSYNADVIVESNARPTLIVSTSASIDEGTNNYNNTLFEVGFDTNNPANGVPAHNTTFTARDNPNYSYKMAPSYNAPNGILIDSVITNGTYTFTTPAAYGVLSFIGLGGNGGDSVTVKVFHQDGSTESGNYGVPDWFNGTSEIACIMGGRCTQVYNLTTEVSGNGGDGLGNPRIYHREITLANTTSPVTKVSFFYAGGQGGAHSDIMAVSGGVNTNGAISPITVTGYDQDFVVEATAPHDNRVTSQVVVDGTNVWSTTESMDNTLDTATSWYEQGYNINNDASGTLNNINDNLTGTGLPHPSGFVTNITGDHLYQMAASYETNDAIYISTTVTNDSITLATPAAFSGISFLGAAGNGPMTVNVVIHHSGAADENQTLTVADWFNGSETPVIACNGRVAVDTAQFSNVKSGFPAVFENDIALQNTTAPVTGLDIYNTNLTSGRFSLFAMSGISGALPPIISAQPISTNNYQGTDLSMSATITANATITYQWEFQTNNAWVNVVNGGHVSGATASTLVLNPLQFSDQGNYRLLATDSGGEAITGTATVDVFSTNVDVTQPGDPITGLNISPFGDGSPSYTIDNTMNTKFGANFNAGAIPGLVVTPSAGQTIITGLRIYTGADTTGRDPTSFEIYGSVDGGHSYTLITSNGIVLSDNRNPLSAVLPDPLTQFCTEVRFPNTEGYTTYKLLFPTFKQNINQIQFQEMELLGVKDNAKPYFSPEPFDTFAYNNSSASFTASVVFTNTTTEAWYKSVNGTVTPLSDGGNISGTQTATLSINPVSFSDAVDYFAVANSSVGSVTSAVAHLFVYSTETNVLQPTDPIGSFGNATAIGYLADDNPAYVIDGTTIPWQAEGHGVGAQAGFPPWEGPVGVWVTPAAGPTVVNGIRFYSGQDSSESDPAAYILEGGNGGTNGSFTVIAQGAITVPQDRSTADIGIDPTQDPALEILFNNTTAYTTYRITFPTLVDTNDVSYLEIGEVQLLGSGAGVTTSSGPHLGNLSISGGNITISATDGTPGNPYTILTNSAINAPLTSWGTAATGTFDSNGSLQTSLPVRTNTPYLFYVIKTQ